MSRNLFSIRLYLALIIIATSLIGTSALAQGATVVRVDPSTSSAQVNDRVTLPIKIDNVANFTAFEIHLSFDPKVLEVMEVTNGGFIAADFPVQNVFDNAAGTIDYAVAQMNRAPAQGSGTLLNIVFRAKANGNSTVALRSIATASSGLLLSDQNGMALQASWVSGSVNVGSGATPIPPTVAPLTPTATPVGATPPTATPAVSISPTATLPVSATPTATIPQTAAVVRIDPPATSALVNDTFNLLVKVDNAASLSAFELHLSFDANILEVTGLNNGGFVSADVAAQNTFSNTAGTIDYAIAQNVRPPSQGSGTLLTIVFRAKSAGTSSVSLRGVTTAPDGLLLSDANGMVLPDTWTPGSVTVTTSIPTSTRIHEVRFGEWLYCIGRAYSVDPWAIAEANGVRWWPYIIFPGQKLTIPNVPWVDMPPTGTVCQAQFAAPVLPILSPTVVPVTPIPVTSIPVTVVPSTIIAVTVNPPTATPVPSSACRFTHIVRSGDTMYRIGISYGVDYTEIARVNQISNARLIYVGQSLCIP